MFKMWPFVDEPDVIFLRVITLGAAALGLIAFVVVFSS